jgi:hypothetical protein
MQKHEKKSGWLQGHQNGPVHHRTNSMSPESEIGLAGFLNWRAPDRPLDWVPRQLAVGSPTRPRSSRWRAVRCATRQYCSRSSEFYNKIPETTKFSHTGSPMHTDLVQYARPPKRLSLGPCRPGTMHHWTGQVRSKTSQLRLFSGYLVQTFLAVLRGFPTT